MTDTDSPRCGRAAKLCKFYREGKFASCFLFKTATMLELRSLSQLDAEKKYAGHLSWINISKRRCSKIGQKMS